jgi:ribosomal protein S12 methylthiotransferase accessory factor
VEKVDELPIDDVRRSYPIRFVIFDLQRIIVFCDSGLGGDPGISSLTGFLLDGYPLQPFQDFASAERGRPYRFCFDLASLDIAACCLKELAPGEYTAIDLLNGELLPGRLRRHPRAASRCRIVPAREVDAASPIRRVTTDRGLRERPPPELRDLINRHAGIIRFDQLVWDSASLPFAVTQIASKRGANAQFCYGKATSPGEARSVARCEAVERFQVTNPPPGTTLVRGSYSELSDYAIDPRRLFFGRSPQCPDDLGRRYDPEARICWAWAWGPAESRWRLVPAQEVWYNVPERMAEHRFVRTTTSGCALGSTFEEAAVWAVLEAVERDSFLTSWYLRRPAREIDFDSFESDELRDLVGRLELALPAYRKVLFDLTSDIGIPTIGGLALRQSGDGPRVFASAATHIDPEKACFRALKDLTGFEPRADEQRSRASADLWESPDSIIGPEDHFLLYAGDAAVGALRYLRLGRRPMIAAQDVGEDSPIPRDAQLQLDDLLELLSRRFRDVGAALYIKDLSHPTLEDCGLRAARAITPSLYPLWFGARYRRFDVSDRLVRLAERYDTGGFQPARLQLAPHPLS